MIKLTRTDKVDLVKYEENIRSRSEIPDGEQYIKDGFIYFDLEMFEEIKKFNRVREQSLRLFVHNELITRTGGGYMNDAIISFNLRDSLIEYLLKVVRVGEASLRSRDKKSKTDAPSVSAKVLGYLIDRGKEADLLTAYLEYTSMKKLNSDKSTKYAKPTNLLTEDGAKLSKIHFHIDKSENLRYVTSDVSVINIAKVYNHCISVNKGYFLVSADLGQADFTQALSIFIIDETNYKHFEKYEDAYEAMYSLMCERNNTEFDREKFLEMRDAMKVYTLVVIYGTEQEELSEGREYVELLNKFLLTCPRYQEYKRRIGRHIDLGISATLKDYFGNENIIDLSSKKAAGRSAMNAVLNSPIQQNTSCVIIHIINRIIDRFKAYGFDRSDIQLYYPRHDEALFICSDRIKPYLWIFADFEKIFIDNLRPLSFKFDLYTRYKLYNKTLTEEYQRVVAENKPDITIVDKDPGFNTSYIPIRDVLEIVVNKVKIPDTDNWIISIYYPMKKTADYLLLENIHQTMIDGAIQSIVSTKISEVYDNEEYAGVLAYSSLNVKAEGMVEDVYFKWNQSNPNYLCTALILAENKLWQYCINNDIDYRPAPNILNSLESIEGISRENYIRV